MTTVDQQPQPSGRHQAQSEPGGGAGTEPIGTEPTPPATRPAAWRANDRRLLLIGAVVVAAILVLAVVIALVRAATNPRHGAGHGADRHRVAGTAHGRDEATLDLVSGATTVTVRSGDLGSDMYRISTPEHAAQLPAVVDRDDRVEVQLADSGEKGASTVLIELSDHVAWHLRIGGGAAEASVDLRKGGVASVDFPNGVSSIDLSLPSPHGTVPVTVAGGASTWSVHLPAGVAAQLRVGAGASAATFDGTQHSGISGGTTYQTDGYDSATDRYHLDAASGVSTIVVDRR